MQRPPTLHDLARSSRQQALRRSGPVPGHVAALPFRRGSGFVAPPVVLSSEGRPPRRPLRGAFGRRLAVHVPEGERQMAEAELNKLRRLADNRRCGTCRHEDRLGFNAVCVKFQIFVCGDCKSAHQAFSHRCKVRSGWRMVGTRLPAEPVGRAGILWPRRMDPPRAKARLRIRTLLRRPPAPAHLPCSFPRRA